MLPKLGARNYFRSVTRRFWCSESAHLAYLPRNMIEPDTEIVPPDNCLKIRSVVKRKNRNSKKISLLEGVLRF
ncbi:MAG: hypothetical protein CMQ27_04425 [Gammaproteobacteria bacterium]|nr:hypothetical protein [Gammaproteobacteria bacterium]